MAMVTARVQKTEDGANFYLVIYRQFKYLLLNTNKLVSKIAIYCYLNYNRC